MGVMSTYQQRKAVTLKVSGESQLIPEYWQKILNYHKENKLNPLIYLVVVYTHQFWDNELRNQDSTGKRLAKHEKTLRAPVTTRMCVQDAEPGCSPSCVWAAKRAER